MEECIASLSAEVQSKEQLEKMLNERQVKAELKRQNLDVSMSAASCSISDNSHITGVRKG